MGKQPGPQEEKSVVLQLIHTARLQRTRAAALLAEIGLFPGQDQVLQCLLRHGAKSEGGAEEALGMPMGDLAIELHVRAPTVSKTIARLTAQGLVERKGVDTDKRQVRVTLTQEGRVRAVSIDAITERLEDELTSGLDGKERKRFRKMLRRAARNLAALSGDADGHDEAEDGED
jgi:DNA-binding MarR family transcriptional regulator